MGQSLSLISTRGEADFPQPADSIAQYKCQNKAIMYHDAGISRAADGLNCGIDPQVDRGVSAHHQPGIELRTIAKPELMTSASRVNAPTDCAITMVVHTHASSRNSADRQRIATRQRR